MESTTTNQTALRIQAAAVVAQQTALTEEEWRLQQRQKALEEQEQQLARHLEERQVQLEGLKTDVRQARAAHRLERANTQKQMEAVQADLDRQRIETEVAHSQALAERDHLRALRQRFIRRWQKHWDARRKELDTRQATLDLQEKRLNGERSVFDHSRRQTTQELEQQRIALEQAQAILNERESSFADRCRAREQAQAQRERQLDQRAASLADEMQLLAAERVRVQEDLQRDHAELAAVDLRIRAEREQLSQLDQRRRDAMTTVPGSFTLDLNLPGANDPNAVEMERMPIRQRIRQREAELQRFTESLADHRRTLIEQLGQLITHQRGWHTNLRETVSDMEMIGDQFEFVEQQLDRHASQSQATEAELAERLQLLQQQQDALMATRSRIEVELNQVRTELQRQRIDLDAREAEIAFRESLAHSLVHRLSERRRADRQILRSFTDRCDRDRQQWIDARHRWEQLEQVMADERQQLAEQSFALEKTRQAWLTDVPETAQKQLIRLERWLLRERARMTHAINRREDSLDEERANFERDLMNLIEMIHTATHAHNGAADRLSEADYSAYLAKRDELRALERLGHWRQREHSYLAQIAELHAEVERLASFVTEPLPVQIPAPMPAIEGEPTRPRLAA